MSDETMNNGILCFAIVGHPNEGKSSVVSTLAEDDSVRISPFPGETRKRQVFPFRLDGKEILRFIDTPGFQRPGAVIEWMKERNSSTIDPVSAFISEFTGTENFTDEIEIFKALSASSGIIYVADTSKPIRRQDRYEMEILRLTGMPRMAVLNSKDDNDVYINEWRKEFLLNFNSVRIFNAHKAKWSERIDLIESLRLMDQTWSIDLGKTVLCLRNDIDRRIMETAILICGMIESSIGYSIVATVNNSSDAESLKNKLAESYRQKVSEIEKKTLSSIRSIFRHRVFNVEIQESIEVETDYLFSKSTWKVLGLNQLQLSAAGGAAGASLGAIFDIAAHGMTMGAFTAIGAITGAASAWIKGEDIVKTKAAGISLGGYRVKAGPCKNIQLMFVLLDRALLYFYWISKRPHGQRDNQLLPASMPEKENSFFLSRNWNNQRRKIASDFFYSILSSEKKDNKKESSDMEKMMIEILNDIYAK